MTNHILGAMGDKDDLTLCFQAGSALPHGDQVGLSVQACDCAECLYIFFLLPEFKPCPYQRRLAMTDLCTPADSGFAVHIDDDQHAIAWRVFILTAQVERARLLNELRLRAAFGALGDLDSVATN